MNNLKFSVVPSNSLSNLTSPVTYIGNTLVSDLPYGSVSLSCNVNLFEQVYSALQDSYLYYPDHYVFDVLNASTIAIATYIKSLYYKIDINADLFETLSLITSHQILPIKYKILQKYEKEAYQLFVSLKKQSYDYKLVQLRSKNAIYKSKTSILNQISDDLVNGLIEPMDENSYLSDYQKALNFYENNTSVEGSVLVANYTDTFHKISTPLLMHIIESKGLLHIKYLIQVYKKSVCVKALPFHTRYLSMNMSHICKQFILEIWDKLYQSTATTNTSCTGKQYSAIFRNFQNYPHLVDYLNK